MTLRLASTAALLAILLALPGTTRADFQLWTEAGVRYKINKQFRLKFDQHLRFDENVSAVRSLMPELAVSYRPLKFLRFQAGYRYIAEPIESLEDTYIESWHRFFVDVRLRYRFKPVTLRYRLRFQEQFGFPWTDGEELDTTHTFRNKLEVQVTLGAGFKPFLSGEIFNRIGDADGPWHKWRLSVGLEYSLKKHDLTLFYRFEDYLNGNPSSQNRHILCLGYHYGF